MHQLCRIALLLLLVFRRAQAQADRPAQRTDPNEAESVCGFNRMHYDQAMPFRQTPLLALLFLPCFSVAQDRDLNHTIDNFKQQPKRLHLVP